MILVSNYFTNMHKSQPNWREFLRKEIIRKGNNLIRSKYLHARLAVNSTFQKIQLICISLWWNISFQFSRWKRTLHTTLVSAIIKLSSRVQGPIKRQGDHLPDRNSHLLQGLLLRAWNMQVTCALNYNRYPDLCVPVTLLDPRRITARTSSLS